MAVSHRLQLVGQSEQWPAPRSNNTRGICSVKLTLETEGSEKLLERSSEWDFTNPPAATKDIEAELTRLMDEEGGIGFASNQAGFLYRIFAMKIDDEVRFFYNPEIIEVGEVEVVMEEGCLSFPGLFFKVKRPSYVGVRYQDSTGAKHEELLQGIAARCFQHELDHLDGICFTDRVSKLTLDMAKKKRAKRERKN